MSLLKLIIMSVGRMLLEWHLPYIACLAFQLWGHLVVDLLVSSLNNQCKHYYILGDQSPLGSLVLNTLNHLWLFKVSCIFPPPALVLVSLSTFLIELITGQFRILMLAAHCWFKATWHCTVHNML